MIQSTSLPHPVEDVPAVPEAARDKILGIGKEELQKLYDQLHGGDPAAREQVRAGLESDLKSLASEVESAPDQLQRLKEESEYMTQRLTEASSPEELEQIMMGFQFARQKKIDREKFQKGLQGDLPSLKNLIVGKGEGMPASILAATGILAFSESEMARIQAAESKEEVDQLLRSMTRDKTENFFGHPVELDSEDILMLSEEVHAQQAANGQGEKSALEKVPVVGTALEGLAAAKNLIYFNVVRRASDDLKISKGVLFRLGTMTVGELRQYLAAFDSDSSDLDPKVADAFKLLDMIDDREEELQSVLEKAIGDFKQEGFREEDRERLKASLTVENLSILSILSYWYMDTRERENWLTHFLSRIPTMKRVWKHWVKNFDATMAMYGSFGRSQRQFEKWTDKMTQNKFDEEFGKDLERVDEYEKDKKGKRGKKGVSEKLKTEQKFDMKRLDAEMTSLQGELDKFEGETAAAIKKNDQKALRELAPRREVLLRRYNVLAHQKYAPAMSKLTGELVKEGKVAQDMLGTLQSSGKQGTFHLSEVFQLTSEQKALLDKYEKSKVFDVRGKHSLQEWQEFLVSRPIKRVVTFRQAHDAWQKRFMKMEEALNEKMLKPFSALEKGVKKSVRAKGDVLEEIRKTQTSPGKALHFGKKAALPVLVIGSELWALAKGEVKGGEVPWDLIEAGAGFVPVVGTGLDFKAAIGGKSLSGRELSFGERAASFGFGILGAIADVGTLAFGLGYGLRAGMGALRGARAAKSVAKLGRYQSAVFRAGAKIGSALSFLKVAGRERKFAHLVEGIADQKDATRLIELLKEQRKLKKAGGSLDAAKTSELAVLQQRIDPTELGFLKRRGFYRKGQELWLKTKQGIVKKTLPKHVVDEMEALQVAKRVAGDKVLKAKADIQNIRGSKAPDRFDDAEFADFLKNGGKSTDPDVHRAHQAITKKDGPQSVLEKAKRSHDSQCRRLEAKDALYQLESLQHIRELEMYDKMTKYATRAGLPMAALMILTAGNVTPVDVVETGAEVIGTGAHVTGQVAGKVLEDHTAPTSIEAAVAEFAPSVITSESSVEDQIAAAAAEGQRRELLEREKAKGVSEEAVLAEHADDPGFAKLGLEDGYTDHVIPPESIEYQSSIAA